jgi:hypothetical protein
MDIKRIIINKNRGWRGLAEVIGENEKRETVLKMVFSFSSDMWAQLMYGNIVLQDTDNYYVVKFDNTDKLPHGHQRSVLIKNFVGTVTEMHTYKKTATDFAGDEYYIRVFKANNNHHTTSDWNCIGIRVNPII